ncbi:glycosyltransferase family 2 protein [Metabacillus malikii]|uniref:Glycosyltransferase 2-like domain-containing protein n=1 Tax=Metabacillus malikii TaxID=1504265 RepID=A0ABT9ZJR3_9BACI|nr:glycosyltransferase family A protein [Metabacillus malikii]MDQ0232502.1 hypothetical protein [Metabacillus malikii]
MNRKIHVFLIDYKSTKSINVALKSLFKINRFILTTTAFVNDQIQIDTPLAFQQIKITQFKRNNLNKYLNETLQSVSEGYVLFLFDRDYLSNYSFIEKLKESKQTIFVQKNKIRNITLLRPFFIHTSLLKRTNFFHLMKVPFNEAILNGFLHSLVQEGAVFTIQFEQSLSQTTSSKNPNVAERMKFISKYLYKPKSLQTSAPTISIIISTYNMAEYVEEAISSCLLQTELPEKIVIIDDGSTDETYQRISNYSTLPIVIVKKQAINLGKAKSLNTVLPLIKTDYILELDADDWLDPDAIQIIKSQLLNLNQNISVFYGNFRRWKQQHDTLLYKNISKGYPIQTKEQFLSYHFPLGPRIYKTRTIRDIGGFPITKFEQGRFYEDVSTLYELLKISQFSYKDFTVYNIREHDGSITKRSHSKWNDFLKHIT